MNHGICVSQPRVARLMRKIGIKSITRKKYQVCTTDSSHDYRICKNHLDRDFSTREIGRKWVSDMTYIATRKGWLYLTTVMDLADRKIIGWSLSDGMKAHQTVIPAFKMARPTVNRMGVSSSIQIVVYSTHVMNSRRC